MQRAITDLAVEARNEYMEKYTGEHGGEIDGVTYSERTQGEVSVSEINVLNEAGEQAVGRKAGKYITISFPDITLMDYAGFERLCEVCAGELSGICKTLVPEAKSLLVCGIGNAKMTPDAIGPQAVSHVLVTRSLREREPEIFERSGFFDVCAIAPGVGADTGFDASDIVRAAADRAKPDIIVAIDALAARSVSRLCKTVQICTAGISPGAGVGNAARALDSESMGVPVVALGVPTVVDTRTLVRDAVGKEEAGAEYGGLFVCPKEIDAQSAKLSRLLGFAINRAFHNLDLKEMTV